MFLLGYDIGSSSVKACILDAQSGKIIGSAFYPKQEAPIISHQMGWAEQEPESWWNYLKAAPAAAISWLLMKIIARLKKSAMVFLPSASATKCMGWFV